MMSGWSFLKNTISSSHGSTDIYLLNKLQKFEIQLAKKHCHIKFLTECRKLQLVPNGLRLKFPYDTEKKVKTILQKTESKLLKEVIRILFIQLHRLEKEKTSLLSTFSSKYSDLKEQLIMLLSSVHDSTINETKNIHQKKIEQLLLNVESQSNRMHSSRCKVVTNTIVNLAEDLFKPTEDESLILSLGLNYAIPMQLELNGVIDFMSATEGAIEKAKLKGDDAIEFRTGIIKILEKHKPPQFQINRMKWISRAIMSIKQNKNIVILSADKGNSTVIMKKIDYEKKVYEHISSQDYSKATHDPIDVTKKSISLIIEKCATRSYIKHKSNMNENLDVEEQKQWILGAIKKWTPKEPVSPIFYGLPKLHKDGHPLRPIVDFRGSISYHIAKHINSVLKNYTKSWKYSTTNSYTFLKQLKAVTIPRGYKMVSFDVKSLFTKVPVHQTIKYLEHRLTNSNSWKKRTDFTLTEFMELVRICSSSTFFKFRDQIYKQENGLPMGSPLSPVMAEFCMQSLEESLVGTHQYIKFWVRYVDDIYAIVKERKVNDILSDLNGYHPCLQFTVEEESLQNVWGVQKSGLPFLDVMIYRTEDSTLGHCVYRKPTHTNRYLHFTSSHPKAHKISVVDSQITRALQLCDNETLEKELAFDIAILKDNGYPAHFIQKRIVLQKYKHASASVSHGSQSNSDDENEELTEEVKRAVLPYYEGVTEKVASFIRYTTDLDIAYVPQNKISHHFNQYKDKKRTTPAGIYELPCGGNNDDKCPLSYIGESRQGLDKRAQQHMYNIRNANIQTSAPAEHVWTNGHNIDPSTIRMIELEPNTFKRKVKEGLYIRSNSNSMNKNKGLLPHPTWTHILKKNFKRHREKIMKRILSPP